jgi:hypothetical protein
MKIIITQNNTTVIAENVTVIKPLFIDMNTGYVSETVDDDTDFYNTEFCIATFTLNDEMEILAIYATEEEREYAKYQLCEFLADTNANKFNMPERK